MVPLYAGTAGWSLSRPAIADFPVEGSHLARYAARLPTVEINSSFYRPHRASTYARWAAAAPPGFRFAVKVPKEISHQRRLQGIETPWRAFLSQVSTLQASLGVLLVQLPPSLSFDPVVAREFFDTLRADFDGLIACEPQHASWFGDVPDALMRGARIARVAADPAPVTAAANPGGWDGFAYHRLHGSPKMYYSNYPDPFLADLAKRLAVHAAAGRPVWCIFDNTAAGCALSNALRTLAFASGRANYGTAEPI